MFKSIVPSDDDDSSPGDINAPLGIAEEEVQSALGPSISRAQTRMLSPQTPAVEKSAAIGTLDGDNIFDDAPQNQDQEVDQSPEELDTFDKGSSATNGAAQSGSTSHDRPARPPKVQQSSDLKNEGVQSPAGMLADLNVRRYMGSFSMPRMPLLNKLPVPSLTSVFANARAQSPLRRGSHRKRATTLGGNPHNEDFGETASVRQDNLSRPDNSINLGTGRRRSQSQSIVNEIQIPQEFVSSPSQRDPSRPPDLRRTTSDQSLYLRRVVSGVPSLGDDSRWEHVQEQVNSRVQALRDSFQDSSFKLPSLPSLPSFNLKPFRQDHERVRAHSDVKGWSKSESDKYGLHLNGQSSEKHVSEGLGCDGRQSTDRIGSRVSPSHFENALEQLTGDVVVLGGYRGSILRSATPPHRQLWVPVKVGLNIRKVNLEVGLEPEDEENMEQSIFSSGMLSHIGPVDMGRRLLKKLKNCRNALDGKLRVHDYGYDWRLSPHLLSQRLSRFVEQLPSNRSSTPPQKRGTFVVAHSMGGLITRHAVNERPELFAGIVYAGVPQHCINILGPLRNGDDVLLSSRVLTAQVNFTIRSSFLLLPDSGLCFTNKETKEEYPIDFFNIDTWKQHALSPCVCSIDPPWQLERKGLLGSFSSSIPILPGLPFPNRRLSCAPTTQLLNDAKQMHAELQSASAMANPAVPSTNPAKPVTSVSSNESATTISTASPLCTIPIDKALDYLYRTLRETLKFRQELAHNLSHQAKNAYPPHAIIYATNTPTVSRARVACRAAIRCADAYDDLAFASGDGVVLARAAQLPEGYQCARNGRTKSDRGHVGLLGDLEAVGRSLEAVICARRNKVGLGIESTGRDKTVTSNGH